MQIPQNRKQEEAEDIFFGQVVIIWARWFVIGAGMIYALWVSRTATQLTIAILLFSVIIGVNFFVHGRYLMEKPINEMLLLVMSMLDLFMVTMIVVLGSELPVINNSLFIFYYPLVVAFAFVFPQRFTAVYTILIIITYATVCIVTYPTIVQNGPLLETLIMRLVTLAAVGGLGAYYWRIQRNRRRELAKTFQSAI